MSATKFVVTGPLVIVRHKTAGDQYIYRGGELPDWVSEEDRKRFVDRKLVAKIDPSDASTTTAVADLGDKAAETVFPPHTPDPVTPPADDRPARARR